MTARRRSLVRRSHSLVAACALLVLLAGCGNSPTGGQTPVPSAAATDTSTPFTSPSESSSNGSTDSISPSESDSVEPDPTDSPSDDPGSEGAEPTDDGTPKPPVLDQQASGRDLALTDVFMYPEGWSDGRFTVAGKSDLTGISGSLSNCYSDTPDSPATIEFRLSNNFAKFSMMVGQSDDSETSDAVVTVRILTNGTYRDQRTVPFNKLVPISASVTGVNALKIQFWKSGDKCDSYKSVNVVLTQLRVE